MKIFWIILTIIAVVSLVYIICAWRFYRKMSVAMSFKDIFKKIDIPGVTLYNNGKPFTFIIDTGSSHCVIDKRVIDELKYVPLSNSGTIYGIDGKKVPSSLVMLELTRDNYNMIDNFQVLEMPAFDNLNDEDKDVKIAGILGGTFLNKYGFIVNYKDYTLRR